MYGLSNMSDKRIDEIDYIKGIGILLVVIGHLSLPQKIVNVLFCFHIPIFIFASGVVYNYNHTKKNVIALLKNYLLYGSLMTLVYAVLNRSIHQFIVQIAHVLLGGTAPFFRVDAAPALWFLSCLAVVEILYYITNKIKCNQFSVSLVFILVALILKRYRESIPIIYNADIALYLYPYFMIGNKYGAFLIKKVRAIESNIIKLIFGVICIGIITIASFVTKDINIFRGNYGRNIVLYYVVAIIGIIAVCMFSGIKSKLNKAFIWLSRRTIIIMATHQLPILYLNKYILKASHMNHVYLKCSVILFCVLLFELLLIYITDKLSFIIRENLLERSDV